jgi:hypothetical protein
MMKAIKMYWNNTTLIYKITALLLLPLVVIFTSRIPVLSGSDGSDPEFSVIGFGILIDISCWKSLQIAGTLAVYMAKNFAGLS